MKNTVYCFDHIIASGILVYIYSHYKKYHVYISDKSGQGLQERLHPNPNIKIKIVTMMIAREFVVFKLNRTQILKVGRNQFTPNKDMLVIFHTECLIALITSNTYIYMLIFRIDTLTTIITWYAIFLVNLALDLALVYIREVYYNTNIEEFLTR